MTALHLASKNGHVEVATALLEKGAAIDLTDLVSLSCVLALHVVTQNGVWFSCMVLYIRLMVQTVVIIEQLIVIHIKLH